MKTLPFLAAIAFLTACAESPTAPSASPNTQPGPSTLREARNPSTTGQPGASCGSQNALIQPNGFGTEGFTHAALVYAGSVDSHSNPNNPSAVAQYDVACYQLSNR